MTPEQFIAKWRAADLKESAAAQSPFNDRCRRLDEPTPTDADPGADPGAEWYAFEKGASKTTGGLVPLGSNAESHLQVARTKINATIKGAAELDSFGKGA